MSKKKYNLEKNNHIISEINIKQYVFERFEDVKTTNKIRNLVKFQAMNKYMIMVHDQEELKKLGNIVASYKKKPFSEILEDYELHLRKSLEKHPTIKKHVNVIMHIIGYFSKNLNQIEKERLFFILDEYKGNRMNIGDILAEISLTVFRFNNTYLASQTYFLLYSNTQSGILLHALNNNN